MRDILFSLSVVGFGCQTVFVILAVMKIPLPLDVQVLVASIGYIGWAALFATSWFMVRGSRWW